jgi:hypothetical protein
VPPLPIDYPTIGTTPPGTTPETLAWVPAQPETLLQVTEAPVPPTTLTMTPVVEEVPEELQPPLPPKAYRN